MKHRYLTKEEIVSIHNKVIDESGGSSGIFIDGNLDSATDAPRRIVFGHEPFQTLSEKAATLFHEVNKLHPFVDGNKRTAYIAADTFLRLNGCKLNAEIEQAVDISLRTARCTADISEVIEWVKRHHSRILHPD